MDAPSPRWAPPIWTTSTVHDAASWSKYANHYNHYAAHNYGVFYLVPPPWGVPGPTPLMPHPIPVAPMMPPGQSASNYVWLL